MGSTLKNQEMSTFTCEICIEPMSSEKMFKNNDYCVHPFCMDCLAKYIQAKVSDNIGSIKCPGLNCDKLLDPLICKPIISSQLFIKWCDCLCESSLLEYQGCYCPNKNCLELVINECKGNVKKSKCPKCNILFCYKCKIPWHAGYWCSESSQRRDANDVKFGQLVEKFKWTRCPQCGQAVERVTGCQSVLCRCGNTFCHQCGEKMHFGPCSERWKTWCFELCFYILIAVFFILLLEFVCIYLSSKQPADD